MYVSQHSEQNFLDEQETILKKALDRAKDSIREAWNDRKPALRAELLALIKRIKAKFDELQRSQQVKEAEYIQFSFLRTGVLLRNPWYRIDIYDKDWRISEVECDEKWLPVFWKSRFER